MTKFTITCDKMHNYLQSHSNGGPRAEDDFGATLLLNVLVKRKGLTILYVHKIYVNKRKIDRK
jgi:hypothetical protein